MNDLLTSLAMNKIHNTIIVYQMCMDHFPRGSNHIQRRQTPYLEIEEKHFVKE